MNLWFAAADLAILPYRLSMGGSGALQQALQRNTPVVMSKAIQAGLGLNWPNSFDGNDPKRLAKAVDKYFEDRVTQKEVIVSMSELTVSRRISKLLPEHFEQVYVGSKSNKVMLEWNSGKSTQEIQAMVG